MNTMETHKFKTGELVNVYNTKFNGEPFLEGQARIVKPTDVYNQYLVQFVDKNGKDIKGEKYTRFCYEAVKDNE